jgi:hypothetical protein
MLCMRIESDRACESGGWYHEYGSGRQREYLPLRIAQVTSTNILHNAAELISLWNARTTLEQYEQLVRDLGVSLSSLISIGAAWARPYSQLGRMIHPNAWAFPMRQADGRIGGIRLRNSDGLKWAVSGSRGGLFMPDDHFEKQEIVFLPEGPTNTAAALTMGLYAWGRPNCNSGAAMIREAMKIHGIRKAVIVADNDDRKQNNSLAFRPGIDGAHKLKVELGMPSVIYMTPLKDLREYLKHGADYSSVMSIIKQKIWTK